MAVVGPRVEPSGVFDSGRDDEPRVIDAEGAQIETEVRIGPGLLERPARHRLQVIRCAALVYSLVRLAHSLVRRALIDAR